MSDKDLRIGLEEEDSQFQANHASNERVEKQLHELALFADLNPSPLIRFDKEGMVLMANPTAIELLGPNTVQGTPICDILPATENVNFEDTIRDGVVFTYAAPIDESFYEFMVIGVPELGIGHIYGSDITEHKRAELALRKSQNEFHQLAHENAIIAEIGRIVSASLNIDEIYERFAEQVRKLMPFDRMTISEVDVENQEFTPVYVAGLQVAGWEPHSTHPVSHTRLEPCVYDREPLLFDGDSTERHTRENPTTAAGASVGLRSGVAAPIISRDQVIGVLNLSAFNQNAYSQNDLHLTELIAAQISGPIANARLYEALRESEEQVRLLLNSTAEAIYGIDLEGNCTFSNPACLQLLGYDYPSDLLGKNMHDLIHHTLPNGEPYAKEECLIYQAVREETGTHVEDEVLWRADGASFPVEYWSYPVRRGGEIVGSVVTFLDVTERRQAEQALRESEERLSKIFENSNDAIFVIDPENDVIVDGNLATFKMLGYSREELLSLPVSSIHPSEMPELMTFSQSVFDQGSGWTDELSCMTKAGDVLPAEISASVVNIAGRNCIVAIVRDITERKFVEKTQRERAILGERNRIARDIHDSIAQSLTGIIWQLNVLDRTVQKGEEEATKSIDRVRSLARDALQEARRSVWDLRVGSKQGQALSDTLKDELEKLTGDSSIEAHVVVEGNESVLPSGMETALLRIYQESMANVLKYSEATRVDVTLMYEDNHVHLSVQDNGAGFDTEVPILPRRNGEGGGFGLINMRERARLLGGDLEVKSQLGQGTRVEAILPLK